MWAIGCLWRWRWMIVDPRPGRLVPAQGVGVEIYARLDHDALADGDEADDRAVVAPHLGELGQHGRDRLALAPGQGVEQFLRDRLGHSVCAAAALAASACTCVMSARTAGPRLFHAAWSCAAVCVGSNCRTSVWLIPLTGSRTDTWRTYMAVRS